MLLSSILLALTNPASAGSSDKVAVCHWSGTTFSQINVSTNAVSAHTTNHASSWGAYDHVAGVFYADLDGDGFGNAASGTSTCQQEGYVPDNTDCDDGDGAVSPDAAEVPYDGVDNDCSAGSADDDLDADGYGFADDCDDSDWTVNPGSVEVAYDGVDNDCEAATPDDDLDADGYALVDDCDDGDLGVNPGEFEVCDDGIDNNCDGQLDEGCALTPSCVTEGPYEAGGFTWWEGRPNESVDGVVDICSCEDVCAEVGLTFATGGSDGWALDLDNCTELGALFQPGSFMGFHGTCADPIGCAPAPVWGGVSSCTNFDAVDPWRTAPPSPWLLMGGNAQLCSCE